MKMEPCSRINIIIMGGELSWEWALNQASCPHCALSTACAHLTLCLVKVPCSVKAFLRCCHYVLGHSRLQKNNLKFYLLISSSGFVKQRTDSDIMHFFLCSFFLKFSTLSRWIRISILSAHRPNFTLKPELWNHVLIHHEKTNSESSHSISLDSRWPVDNYFWPESQHSLAWLSIDSPNNYLPVWKPSNINMLTLLGCER